MKNYILIFLFILIIGCKDKNLYESIDITCDKIYLYKDEEALIDYYYYYYYYYYIFSIKNNSNQDFILKQNKYIKSTKEAVGDIKSLDLEFSVNDEILQSPFVESNIMKTNYIIHKKRNNKIIYFLEVYDSESVANNIVVSNLNKSFLHNVKFSKEIVRLKKMMTFDEAGELIDASFSGN